MPTLPHRLLWMTLAAAVRIVASHGGPVGPSTGYVTASQPD
jgi:hypothetical protein